MDKVRRAVETAVGRRLTDDQWQYLLVEVWGDVIETAEDIGDLIEFAGKYLGFLAVSSPGGGPPPPAPTAPPRPGRKYRPSSVRRDRRMRFLSAVTFYRALGLSWPEVNRRIGGDHAPGSVKRMFLAYRRRYPADTARYEDLNRGILAIVNDMRSTLAAVRKAIEGQQEGELDANSTTDAVEEFTRAYSRFQEVLEAAGVQD